MDLVNLEKTREAYKEAKQAEARLEEGDDVLLSFTLPNGEQYEQRFKAGVTIAFVKFELAKSCNLEANKLVLRINGKTLVDPFSIVDCPQIRASGVNIVDVSIAE